MRVASNQVSAKTVTMLSASHRKTTIRALRRSRRRSGTSRNIARASACTKGQKAKLAQHQGKPRREQGEEAYHGKEDWIPAEVVFLLHVRCLLLLVTPVRYLPRDLCLFQRNGVAEVSATPPFLLAVPHAGADLTLYFWRFGSRIHCTRLSISSGDMRSEKFAGITGL